MILIFLFRATNKFYKNDKIINIIKGKVNQSDFLPQSPSATTPLP